MFVKCKYNSCNLTYKALVISNTNTGEYRGIDKFERICFEEKPVNVFAGPETAFESEKFTDVADRMASIKPKPWNELNSQTEIKIKNCEINLAIDFTFHIIFVMQIH